MSRPMQLAHYVKEAMAATARVILVDLSDTSGYKHSESNGIRLYKIILDAERQDGQWTVRFGLVLECDATDGTVQWFFQVNIGNDDQATDDHSYRHVELDFSCGDDGYQLLRVASDASQRTVSNDTDLTQTWLQTDAGNLEDAQGSSAKSAGAGDLVVEFEEDSGAGTLSATVMVLYATE